VFGWPGWEGIPEFVVRPGGWEAMPELVVRPGDWEAMPEFVIRPMGELVPGPGAAGFAVEGVGMALSCSLKLG
jgi:hypothetical protein